MPRNDINTADLKAFSEKIVRAMTQGQFEQCFSALSPEMKHKYPSPEKLRESYDFMLHIYTDKTATSVEFFNYGDESLADFAYVSIMGNNFSEAVSMTVVPSGKSFSIVKLDWGRP